RRRRPLRHRRGAAGARPRDRRARRDVPCTPDPHRAAAGGLPRGDPDPARVPDRRMTTELAGRPGLRGRLVPPLLGDLPFRRFWAAQTISFFGDQVNWIALPLVAVLALDAGPGQMGLLAAVGTLPNLLFS